MSTPNLTRAIAAGLAATALSLAAHAQGAAAAGSASAELSNTEAGLGRLQRNTMLAEPSVVFVQLDISGVLRETSTGRTYSELGSDGTPDGNPLAVTSFGTGFFVSNSGDIVTAAHVAAPSADMLHLDLVDELIRETYGCSTCDAQNSKYEAGLVDGTTVENLQQTLSVFTQDQAAAAQKRGYPAVVTVSSPTAVHDTAVIKVSLRNTPAVELKDSGTVNVQDGISVIGYPHDSVQDSNAATVLVPTIVSGTVTARRQSGNRAIATDTDVFQTDAPVEHGNSGGPVVAEDGKVIGLVSFVGSQSLSVNFAIQSNDIAGVMRQAHVAAAGGAVDQLWQSGFQAYLDGRYREAGDLLGRCAAMSATQVGCTAYAKKSRGLAGSEAPPASTSDLRARLMTWVPAVVGAALLLGVLVTAIAVLRVRRERTAVAAAAGPSTPPWVPSPRWTFARGGVNATIPAAAGPSWVPAPSGRQ